MKVETSNIHPIHYRLALGENSRKRQKAKVVKWLQHWPPDPNIRSASSCRHRSCPEDRQDDGRDDVTASRRRVAGARRRHWDEVDGDEAVERARERRALAAGGHHGERGSDHRQQQRL